MDVQDDVDSDGDEFRPTLVTAPVDSVALDLVAPEA